MSSWNKGKPPGGLMRTASCASVSSGKSFNNSRAVRSDDLARELVGEGAIADAFDALNPNMKVLTPAIRAVPVATFKADVDNVKKRVKMRTWGLLDPRSKKMQRWDLVVVCALLITCVWAPYEVALIPTALNATFVMNQVINLVFIFDIIFTCTDRMRAV